MDALTMSNLVGGKISPTDAHCSQPTRGAHADESWSNGVLTSSMADVCRVLSAAAVAHHVHRKDEAAHKLLGGMAATVGRCAARHCWSCLVVGMARLQAG